MVERGGWRARGRPLVVGAANGPALVLAEPLSLWGGLDMETGRIIDRRHPQCGQSVVGRVLVMPAGRGSSSSSSVLAEAIRNEKGPAAVVMGRADEIVAVGALVSQLLYGRACPVLVLPSSDYERIRTGDHLDLAESGWITVGRAGALT